MVVSTYMNTIYEYYTGFQIVVLSRFRPVQSGLAMTSSINQIQLLRPFYKGRIIREKMSFGFCKRDKQQFRVTRYCHSTGLRINPRRNEFVNISLVCEFKDKSCLFMPEIGGQCFALTSLRVTLLKLLA